jgi:hypothetical protein
MQGMSRKVYLTGLPRAVEPARIIFLEWGQQLMASANDMKAAEKTYGGFINMIKWSVPVIALIVLFVVVLIS